MKPRLQCAAASEFDLSNPELTWTYNWSDGRLAGVRFEGKLTGRVFPLGDNCELARLLSAATDRVAEPLPRVDDFMVRAVPRAGRPGAVFSLHSATSGFEVI